MLLPGSANPYRRDTGWLLACDISLPSVSAAARHLLSPQWSKPTGPQPRCQPAGHWPSSRYVGWPPLVHSGLRALQAPALAAAVAAATTVVAGIIAAATAATTAAAAAKTRTIACARSCVTGREQPRDIPGLLSLAGEGKIFEKMKHKTCILSLRVLLSKSCQLTCGSSSVG